MTEQPINAQNAAPSGGPVYPAEAAICVCGWEIIRLTTAKRPTWLHQASGRAECGIDDLRRPWSAPHSTEDGDGTG